MRPDRKAWGEALSAAYATEAALRGDVRGICKAFAAALGIPDPYDEPGGNAGTESPATDEGAPAP